ncbi:Acetylornithine deacetylase/Succinyl-diaminopimelate desuccinylase [Albimonas donghaensis]|uniref:Acetylornithine deacetylase/Succinyl-diaminopimelate desuccinylase n=1 Tax=Albimonas donghaensis TaxID=356660 RepID=A0A1H2SKC5_9RHOB|nr:M20/M25/M40 family metallo-hydrolase [Albimonas donghaensis]SDW31978.1 Acetylornithine deacetylase/Succinyl-diaminopimelate desuccinylase [Albimonas donghaensis]
MSHSALPAVLDRLDADLDAAVERLFALLRFPSISTDPAYKPACAEAAAWLVHELNGLGFAAELRPTPGHPMVVAHGDALADPASAAPSLLFYGHYDVQPVDPLNLWNADPFAPAVETLPDGRRVIRARGAVDDKGQLMTFIEACRAWKAETGTLPAKISILFEGEEESGSPSLIPFLEANREELSRDLALICDTGMFDPKTPAISTMLRGMMGEEITVKAASRDLHSGMYGGPASNPIRVLAKILAALHDDTGRVTIPGFYDDVDDISPDLARQWEALPFSAAGFLGAVGLEIPAGEQDRSALEQIWSRPTCEFNGVIGGYTGEGFKTVIAAEASAKVSCRLVSRQDPEKIRAGFRELVSSLVPADCEVVFKRHGSSEAVVMDVTAPEFEAARTALSAEWETEAAFVGCGGSIPIAGHFQKLLGMESLLIGFGNDDDNMHSPNEKYDMESFRKGARSWARVLGELSRKA